MSEERMSQANRRLCNDIARRWQPHLHDLLDHGPHDGREVDLFKRLCEALAYQIAALWLESKGVKGIINESPMDENYPDIVGDALRGMDTEVLSICCSNLRHGPIDGITCARDGEIMPNWVWCEQGLPGIGLTPGASWDAKAASELATEHRQDREYVLAIANLYIGTGLFGVVFNLPPIGAGKWFYQAVCPLCVPFAKHRWSAGNRALGKAVLSLAKKYPYENIPVDFLEEAVRRAQTLRALSHDS